MNTNYKTSSWVSLGILIVCAVAVHFEPSMSSVIITFGTLILGNVWTNAKSAADLQEKQESTAADLKDVTAQKVNDAKEELARLNAKADKIKLEQIKVVSDKVDAVAIQTDGMSQQLQDVAHAAGFTAGVKSEEAKADPHLLAQEVARLQMENAALRGNPGVNL